MNPPLADARCYLRLFALLISCGLALTGLFNLCIDPFGLFHLVEVTGFNEAKPAFFRNLRMAKAHAVRLVKPHGIILGTSRAEAGLDPDHPGWRPDTAPRYNLALSSCRIVEAYSYLRHAHAVSPLRQVVIGLDLMMFDDRVRSEAGFDEARLAYRDHGPWAPGWFHDLVTSLFTSDAIKSSVDTLHHQAETPTHVYLKNGMRDDRYSWAHIQSKGGHRRVDEESVAPEQKWTGFTSTNHSMEQFRTLVKFCYAEGIDLRLFISPINAVALDRIARDHQWHAVEEWKRGLVRTLRESAAAHPGVAPVPLWDFSGYNTITTERFPPLGDTHTQMTWYWESSHYKRVVGDMILDRLFTYHDPSRSIPADFGVALTEQNIDTHLAVIRLQQAEHADHHAPAVTHASVR